jgi:hypothetical protein
LAGITFTGSFIAFAVASVFRVFFDPDASWPSMVFLATALVLVGCNVYLQCRRRFAGEGPSPFPMFSALPAAAYIGATYGGHTFYFALVVFAVIDLIGLPLIGALVSGIFRLDREPVT